MDMAAVMAVTAVEIAVAENTNLFSFSKRTSTLVEVLFLFISICVNSLFLIYFLMWGVGACSSVVERCPDKTEAVGPIPTTPTCRRKTKIKKTIFHLEEEFGGNQQSKYLVKYLLGLQCQ